MNKESYWNIDCSKIHLLFHQGSSSTFVTRPYISGNWCWKRPCASNKSSLVVQYPTGCPLVASFRCPACRTSLIATRFWVVMICPIIKCLTVLEFSFILFDLCLVITIFNFILNYVSVVTFWILTYHKIWILLIIFCFIWSYWIIFF